MASRDLALVGDEDEGKDIFEVGGDDEESRPAAKAFRLTEEDEDSENLVALFKGSQQGLDALKAIADQVVHDFDTDWESTEEYRAQVADQWKLFAAKLPLKSKPFKDAADVHVPSMLENTSRIVNQVFAEVYGTWQGIFSVMKTGPADTDAETLTRFDNYQLTCKIHDFYRQQMRAVLAFFGPGDVVGHSYYDGHRKQNRHEVLTCDDFVVPYTAVTTCPYYSDVPHRTKILHLHRHELQSMRDLWEDVDVVIKRERPDIDDEPESLWSKSVADIHRIEQPTDMRNAPYKLLWYEGWTDEIPGQERDRFIQAIVDYHTRTVLSLTIHEEPSYEEKQRYERELTELEQYREAIAQYEASRAQWEQARGQIEAQAQMPPSVDPMTGMPVPAPSPAEMMAQHAAAEPQHPLPPNWMMAMQDEAEDEVDIYPDPEANQPEPPRKEPIHTFVHAVCIEPMRGNLGIGFGRIQSDHNKALNIIMSQMIDSATLANAWGLIIAGNLEFERPFTHGPGALNIAKGVSGQQLKDSIFPMQPGQANPQMFDLYDRIYNFAQTSAQAPEVLSGEPGKSGETFRGLSARLEQATKQLSVPARTFTKTYLEPTLKNNAKLNAMFLPDEQVCYVNDEFGQPMEIRVSRRMYERDYRVNFESDLRFAGRAQRVAEADEVVAMAALMENPANPVGNVAFKHMAMRKALKARGQGDLIPFLGPPPPPPPTPFGIPPPAPPMPPADPGQPAGAMPAPPPAGPVAPAGPQPTQAPPQPPPQTGPR